MIDTLLFLSLLFGQFAAPTAIQQAATAQSQGGGHHDDGLEVCLTPVEQEDGTILWTFRCPTNREKKKHGNHVQH